MNLDLNLYHDFITLLHDFDCVLRNVGSVMLFKQMQHGSSHVENITHRGAVPSHEINEVFRNFILCLVLLSGLRHCYYFRVDRVTEDIFL